MIGRDIAAARKRVSAAEIAEIEAAADVKAAKGEVALNCKTGVGPKCTGAKDILATAQAAADNAASTLVERQSHARLLEASLALAGPPQTENAGFRAAAEVFATLPFVTASVDTITKALATDMPFLLVVLIEFGTTVFWSVALGHKPTFEPDDKQRVGAGIVDFVHQSALRGKATTLPDVQAAFPAVSKTTAWRRMREAKKASAA
jgi:hypothetical protein